VGFPVGLLEVLHEAHQRVHRRLRDGVVDGDAEAAEGAVPFERHEVLLSRLREELRLEVLGREAEADVHERARDFLSGDRDHLPTGASRQITDDGGLNIDGGRSKLS